MTTENLIRTGIFDLSFLQDAKILLSSTLIESLAVPGKHILKIKQFVSFVL